MWVVKCILLLAAAVMVSSNQLYVSDYSGQITTLRLTEDEGNITITKSAVNTECAPNPSWLTIDANRGLLFCLNEGLSTVNGSLSSFTINTDGSLKHVQNETTINGPVSSVIYGHPAGQRALALAHYGGSAVSNYLLQGKGKYTFNQALRYTLPHPGPVPDRQDAPHSHEALLDPTGTYILVPDLGADFVRIYTWDPTTLALTEKAPLTAPPGSGPRHAAFWNPSGISCDTCPTYLYLVSELAAKITAYEVTYLPHTGGLAFKPVFNTTTLGGRTVPGTAPAEINVTPDNRFLIVSNRNDTSFSSPRASDSLATFSLNGDGTLSFVQLAPAGGVFPRHFSVNRYGNLVAVGLQYDMAVAVLRRDVMTGLIGEEVGRFDGVGGNVTCVVWGDEGAVNA